MDNIAHTLVGAALGQAGLKRRSALAMPALLIGANLPDLDVIAVPLGHSLDFRRGWTHGVLALVVLPLVLTGAMLAYDRWVRRRRNPAAEPVRPVWMLALSCIVILSHPALDWLNTYGLRWLMPFDGRWFYGDAVFIVDPWLWLVLGAGVAISRRRERSDGGWRRPAGAALGAAAVYVVAMIVSAEAAERWVRRELPRRGVEDVRRVMVGPVPANPLRREVVAELADEYVFGELRWTPTPELTLSPATTPIGDDHPAVARARRHPRARRFLVWSRFPFYHVSEEDGVAAVEVTDARYGRTPGGGWASVRVGVPLRQP